MVPTSETQSKTGRPAPHSGSCAQTRPTLALVTISVSPGSCAALLGWMAAGVVVLSLGASFLSFVTFGDPLLDHMRASIVRLTWVDGEANIPSWFSTSLLLTAALLLATIAAAEGRLEGERAARWAILSLIFLFLSIDETVQLHELSIVPLRDKIGATGFLYYAWVLPAGVCVCVFVLAYLRFLAQLPARTRRLLLSAGAVYVGGALGFESLSGWQAALYGEHNPRYHLIITLEELCEMSGIVLFIYTLLEYLGGRFSRVGFHIGPSPRLNRT
jgi:hypothetical protein